MITNLNFQLRLSRVNAILALAVLLASLGGPFSPLVSAQETDAYFARIMTTLPASQSQGTHDAPLVFENGVLVVTDGKVVAVGNADSVEVPTQARKHYFHNETIQPGLVIAQTRLIDQRDLNETLSPQVRAIEGFDFVADRGELLAAGITTVQISPSGNRLMPGVGAIVKLGDGKSEANKSVVLNTDESLRIVLDASSRNAPTIFEPPVGPVSVERPLEPTRPQVSQTLSGSLTALRAVFRAATAQETFVSAEADAVVDAVRNFLDRSKSLRITANTEAEIRGALELAREFGLELTLVDCTSPQLAEILRDAKAADTLPTIRGFIITAPRPGTLPSLTAESLQQRRETQKMWRELIADGWPVAVVPSQDRDLRDIEFSTRELMGATVPNALTLAAAQLLGIADRVGSLDVGRDADFVVVNSRPGLAHSLPVMTFVNGVKLYDRTPESKATIVRARRILSGDGSVNTDAAVVVKGHTIRSLSSDFSAPLDAQIVDYGDAVIVPGYVDLSATFGTGGAISGNIGLNTKLGEQLYPDDAALKLAREHGITTALVGSMNAAQPTPLTLIKLGAEPRVLKDPAAIRFSMGYNPSVSASTLRGLLTRGKQYADSWTKYEQDLKEYEQKKAELEKKAAEQKAKEAQEAQGSTNETPKAEAGEQKPESPAERPATGDPSGRRGLGGRPPIGGRPPDRGETPADGEKPADQKPESKPTEQDPKPTDEAKPDDAKSEEAKPEEPKLEAPKPPASRPELEPYRDLFAGKIPAIVDARDPEAIEAALKLFRSDFQISTLLSGGDGLAQFPNLLEGHPDVGLIAGPNLVIDVSRSQRLSQRINLAEVFANAQIPFAFQSQSASGSAMLPAAVGFAVNQGLGSGDGLQALTKSAADLVIKDPSFGVLTPGRDADLVILSGLPFEAGTEVLAVMIDGQWVFMREGHE